MARRWGRASERTGRGRRNSRPYDFLPVSDPDIGPVFAPVQDGPASQPVTYVDGHNPPMLLLAGAADETVQPRNTLSLSGDIATAVTAHSPPD